MLVLQFFHGFEKIVRGKKTKWRRNVENKNKLRRIACQIRCMQSFAFFNIYQTSGLFIELLKKCTNRILELLKMQIYFRRH